MTITNRLQKMFAVLTIVGLISAAAHTVVAGQICTEERYSANPKIQFMYISDCISGNLLSESELFAAYKARARSSALLGDFGSVIEDLTAALTIKPSDIDSLKKRGIAFKRIGNYKQARLDYIMANKLASVHIQPYTPAAELTHIIAISPGIQIVSRGQHKDSQTEQLSLYFYQDGSATEAIR